MLKQKEPDGMAEQALTSFSHHASDRPTVLIADDSRVVRVSLKNILKGECQVIEAENGQEAWDILCETPSVTLVFSDLSMPKLDGRGLLNKIRNSDSTHLATLPFIVVTGNEESPEIRQELTQLGANDVICKPFDPTNIKEYLTSLASRQEGEDIGQEESEASQLQDDDPQTDFIHGVVDKAQFMESASRELAFAIRNKNELAVALVKIDQIDEITDQYSDPAIEHILLTLVEIIKQHIHPDDSMAYFGNGSFAVLRPASNAIGTRYLGRRILEDLASKQFYLGESEQVVSASIAISAPDIKPGTRLIELISLAESRLKTAIDNGGNQVVDKGNESMASVNLVGDTSELSTNPTQSSASRSTNIQSSPTRSATEIHRLAAEQVAEIKARYGSDKDAEDELTSELIEHKQTIERLTNENRQLINEIAHWKKQSAEAENLRRQLFEIESQQQHLQLKFTELQNENSTVIERTGAIESENQSLIQRTLAIESENQDLIHRAQSTESENQTLSQQAKALENENQNLSQHAKTVESENHNLAQRAQVIENENQKLSQLAQKAESETKDLILRLQELEIENQNLIEESLASSSSGNDSLIEEENKRLENLLSDLTSRAEKAEIENVKSNQLVNTLKDNIKLLNMQLDQLQQQFDEEKKRHQATENPSPRNNNENANIVETKSQTLANSELFSDSKKSDLSLNAMPDSALYSANSEPSSVHLFPDKDQIESKQQSRTKPTIPPFRVEPEPLLFKNGFHLSSFTIASLIFTILLAIAAGYLYLVFNGNQAIDGITTEVPVDLSQVQIKPDIEPPAAKPKRLIQEPVQQTTAPNITRVTPTVDVEKRLEKELTLRRMAEEEFNLKAQ
ncbi:MAG: response regulator [Candidatus Thiodiazotropha sp.]